MRGRSLLVVALFAALSGTPAHAHGPTSAADQFHMEITPSRRTSANSEQISIGRVTYLSDVIPFVVNNGFGPLESDTSNGEQRVGDGNAITLSGATYLKGLGTHAASRVLYALPADCAGVFKALVGVDDEVGPRGSVIFRVFADTTKVYDSGIMTGQNSSHHVNVSVAQAAQLQLIVTKAGDDGAYDHADWACARVECGRGSRSWAGRDLGLPAYPSTLSLLGLVVIAGTFGTAGIALRRRERG